MGFFLPVVDTGFFSVVDTGFLPVIDNGFWVLVSHMNFMVEMSWQSGGDSADFHGYGAVSSVLAQTL
jgi:hypothetical protein